MQGPCVAFVSLTPIIATELFAATGSYWSISLYIVAMAAISFVSVFLLSETYSKDLSEVEDDTFPQRADQGALDPEPYGPDRLETGEK
jgi:hypothetical protein